MKKYLLEITVFLCGAIVMVYEIVGSRVVAPHFGTSIYVWTSLIGVILASLSLGYWLGGRWADKKPSFKRLALIIFGAAIYIIFANTFKDALLQTLSRNFSSMMLRPLLASIILFAPASLFLGMVSPYAIRLKLTKIETSGKIVGNLYAISTLGSIIGTFLAGFLLIPLFGSTNILYMISGILIINALVLSIRFLSKWDVFFFSVVILFEAWSAYAYNTRSIAFIDTDTQYNHVQIFDTEYWISGEPIKVMKVNDEYSSAMFPGNDSLVYEYLQFYQLSEHFMPSFEKALIIGGAGYSYPRFYLQKYDHATIDVVEIDPALTDLAKEHFRLEEDSRMRIFHEDGRTYLNNCKEKYDIIFGDAYKSLMAIPFQLATLEAIQKKYDLLNEDGIVIENLISSLEGPASEFMKAEVQTFLEVFPRVYLFACHDPGDPELLQSICLLACKSKDVLPFVSDDPLIQGFLSHRVDLHIPAGTRVFTDDYAPIEYITMKAM
ncbi:MAG: spermidine synthase [Bacteroidetes bacterium]|nr:MAG: spermidine synthase [Bacteroidota bacterium]